MARRHASIPCRSLKWRHNEHDGVSNHQHYSDVIMSAMASQFTSLTIVNSTVYSGADQRKHQSFASLAFGGEFTGDRWISRTKGQYRGKCFHLMTSSCLATSPRGLGSIFLLECSFAQLPWTRNDDSAVNSKQNCCHSQKISSIPPSCQNGNFRCSQWWKFRRNYDVSVSLNRQQKKYQLFSLSLIEHLFCHFWQSMQ